MAAEAAEAAGGGRRRCCWWLWVSARGARPVMVTAEDVSGSWPVRERLWVVGRWMGVSWKRLWWQGAGQVLTGYERGSRVGC